MGAINDSILTKEFGKIVREEYKSLGIRLALDQWLIQVQNHVGQELMELW